jgi:hypothetical protein
MDRKCCKNGAFTAVFRVNTVRFGSLFSGTGIRTLLYPYPGRPLRTPDTIVYGVVYDRIHIINAPYRTVFLVMGRNSYVRNEREEKKNCYDYGVSKT